MNRTFVFRFVSFIALGFGLVSVVHFLSLVVGAPFWIDALIAIAGCVVLGIWLIRGSVVTPVKHNRVLLILPVGLALLLLNSFTEMEKWGGWDAWAIWNHRASMLENSIYWQRAFIPSGNEHSDYPLCLPAGIAFFNRLLPGLEEGSAALATAWGATVAIVLLLFGTFYPRRPMIALALLLFFATDKTFLRNGLAQYADVLLALFFLLACVAYHNIRDDRRAVFICGAAIGFCPWTKNEGLILALLALLFFGKEILARKALRPFLSGLLLPLLSWVLFKTVYAPAGDMLSDGSVDVWLQRLGDGTRYEVLWRILRDTVARSYGIPALMLAAYLLLRFQQKRALGGDFVLICTAVLVYCSIYLLTPHDPEWHLMTSLSRLLHQLMPATVFICATELSRLSFHIRDEYSD